MSHEHGMSDGPIEPERPFYEGRITTDEINTTYHEAFTNVVNNLSATFQERRHMDESSARKSAVAFVARHMPYDKILSVGLGITIDDDKPMH